MLSKKDLERKINLPLEEKILHFIQVYVEYTLHYKGQVYLSWSGGKDSDTACDIIDRLYAGEFTGRYIREEFFDLLQRFGKPDRIFCNTGLEFPEIVERVKNRKNNFNDVQILKPLMGFPRVIKEIGVAVGSKQIAMMVTRLKKYIANPQSKNAATTKLYLTGEKRDGTFSKASKLAEKWKPLLNAPFPVSDQCCNIFKKEPFHRYEKQTGKKAVVFTTASESGQRLISYLKTGCNSYEKGKERCRPFSIFTEQDVWDYAKKYNLVFAPVYYKRTLQVEQLDGSFIERILEAETRTGCTFCMFGVHLEDKNKNNRIQRLAISHPKYYDIIIHKCGLNAILDFCKTPYIPLN